MRTEIAASPGLEVQRALRRISDDQVELDCSVSARTCCVFFPTSKLTAEPALSYLLSPIKLHDYAAGNMAAFGSVIEYIGRPSRPSVSLSQQASQSKPPLRHESTALTPVIASVRNEFFIKLGRRRSDIGVLKPAHQARWKIVGDASASIGVLVDKSRTGTLSPARISCCNIVRAMSGLPTMTITAFAV